MVRTGVFAPQHAVFQTLPHFKQDYHNEQVRLKAAAKSVQKTAERTDAVAKLTEQAKLMGLSCSKSKTSHRALTPGIFTVFCAGCGKCVLFEMMDHAECPLTPFRIFSHRAWRPVDREAFPQD